MTSAVYINIRITLPTSSTLCPRLPDSARSILHTAEASQALLPAHAVIHLSLPLPTRPISLTPSKHPPTHTSHLTPATIPPSNAAGLAPRPSDYSLFRLPRPHSGDLIPRHSNVLRTHCTHYCLPPREPTCASHSDHPPWAIARPRTPARTRTTLAAGVASLPLQA